MTTFILGCAALVLLSGLFFLLPGRRSSAADDELERANVQWYRLRRAELDAEGADGLQDDARLRLLEDERQAAPAMPRAGSQSFPVWPLLPLVALLSSGLYFQLGAAPDVMISRQLQALNDSSAPQDMQAIMRAVETRSAQRPDNVDYAAMLGRYYMSMQSYDQAAQTYAGLAREFPGDAFALASAAQADYMASGRELGDRARLRAEQALAIDPHQRTALGLLGMASFEQQQYRAALSYWQRLLATEQPDSESARMIAGVMDMARQRLVEAGELPGSATGELAQAAGSAPGRATPGESTPGESTPGESTPGESTPGDLTPGVTVRVELPDGAAVTASDTVFVLARSASSGSRMPIAVQRLQAGQLPITLRLDDSNSMAGQKLSSTDSVVVVVQVSPGGTPGEANATWLGKAGPLAPSLDPAPLEILLQPKG